MQTADVKLGSHYLHVKKIHYKSMHKSWRKTAMTIFRWSTALILHTAAVSWNYM